MRKGQSGAVFEMQSVDFMKDVIIDGERVQILLIIVVL